MRLALKAQAACRSTLEALARLHQPREQTVKHVHVNEGGQAVVADHFHQHTGDRENGKSVKQSDATGAAGTIAALPSPDPLGNGVPIPSRSEEHTSELQSLMRISYAVFCLTKKKDKPHKKQPRTHDTNTHTEY